MLCTLFNALHCYKVEKVLLKQNNKIRTYTTGTLCLTPSYVIFIEPTGVKETWVCHCLNIHNLLGMYNI